MIVYKHEKAGKWQRLLSLPCFCAESGTFGNGGDGERIAGKQRGLDKGGKCLSVVGGGDVATGVDGDGGCSAVESQLYVGCILLHFEQVSLPLYFELEEEREEDGHRKEVSACL